MIMTDGLDQGTRHCGDTSCNSILLHLLPYCVEMGDAHQHCQRHLSMNSPIVFTISNC